MLSRTIVSVLGSRPASHARHDRGAKAMTRSGMVQLFVGAPFAGFFAVHGAHGIVTGGRIAPAVFGLLAVGIAEWFVWHKEERR
jgi:hypothetical protein